MSDNQTQAPVDNRFAPTQNPQNPGEQTLTASTSDAQDTAKLLDGQTSAKITSVGSSTFTPVNTSSETTIAATNLAPDSPKRDNLPVFIGGGSIILICLALTWMQTRRMSAAKVV